MAMNSLIGIPDYDEASNLSTHLIGHGWNADHASSPEQILADLEDGNYELVVFDAGILSDSEWSLDEYIEEIGPEVSVLVLTERGERLAEEVGDGNFCVLQHPYSCWELKSAIARVTQTSAGEDEYSSELVGLNGGDLMESEEEFFLSEELEAAY